MWKPAEKRNDGSGFKIRPPSPTRVRDVCWQAMGDINCGVECLYFQTSWTSELDGPRIIHSSGFPAVLLIHLPQRVRGELEGRAWESYIQAVRLSPRIIHRIISDGF